MENIDLELLPLYFNNLKKNFDKISSEMLKKYNLNNTHFRTIILLNKYESLSLNELTEKVCVDKATTTRVIQDLLDKDIVYKKDDKIKKYKITLTQKGIEIAEYMIKQHEIIHEKLFKGFSEEEKQQFFKLLLKYFKNIKEEI